MPFSPQFSRVVRRDERQVEAKANMASWKSVLFAESICLSMSIALRRGRQGDVLEISRKVSEGSPGKTKGDPGQEPLDKPDPLKSMS